MTIFVAGGSGTIGVPLVRALVAAGHRVTALTRSTAGGEGLSASGAAVTIADALDRDALMSAVRASQPTHVIHQLTALPKAGPRRRSDVDATNRLRIDGTRNLLDAAIDVHARRFIVGSFARAFAPARHCFASGRRRARGGAIDGEPGSRGDGARCDRGCHSPLRDVLR